MGPFARIMTKLELEALQDAQQEVRQDLHACLLPVLLRSRYPGEAKQSLPLRRPHVRDAVVSRASHRQQSHHLLHHAGDLKWAERKGRVGLDLRVNVVPAWLARQTTEDSPRMRKNVAMLPATLGMT